MVGEKIRKLRKEKKLTLKDIAEATGLSIGYIPSWNAERLNRPWPLSAK
jgi:transcriptional regulator with XRE-family HTH domain